MISLPATPDDPTEADARAVVAQLDRVLVRRKIAEHARAAHYDDAVGFKPSDFGHCYAWFVRFPRVPVRATAGLMMAWSDHSLVCSYVYNT